MTLVRAGKLNRVRMEKGAASWEAKIMRLRELFPIIVTN